ncbi:MAG: glycogen/starch/alpha-glucan phosphorylase [Kiritimatiellaeota bacterium]|nr:glycogen/starch/alpha-glucan phosphorylase [Kiritimatiellota bacterium]
MTKRLEAVLERFRSLTGEENFRLSFLHHLRYSCGKDRATATLEDKYVSLALAVRDRVTQHMVATQQAYHDQDVKRVYYISMEYLVGRLLSKNLVNLGILDLVRHALARLDCDLDELAQVERDAALGNGGLGRLAACFMDSLATLGYPAYGYGILYEYGLFRQEIGNGWQRERPDPWLAVGNPWLLVRPEHTVLVPMCGRIEHAPDRTGADNPMWLDWAAVLGEPHDLPMVGYGGKTVNLLRLFKARASNDFDMEIFNNGDFVRAVQQKVSSENISKVLYPMDLVEAGRELRLRQEYFLVACSIRDIVRRYRKRHRDWSAFPDKVAIQMNDTHPALAVAELQRFFVDEAGLDWDRAWDLVTRTLGYTNHTLMAEALEKWPVDLVERLLPRHLEIIYGINQRFLDRVRAEFPGDADLVRRVSLIEEEPERRVRMAHLAVVGSHAVNGVAELHSRLLRQTVLADFERIQPGKIGNVTNGITPRRWLLCCNSGLADCIRRRIGDEWAADLDALKQLMQWERDPEFHAELRAVKNANKQRLAAFLRAAGGPRLNPATLFDVQAKRLHEYKRQLLDALHIIDRYLALREGAGPNGPPRTFLFAAKAAPGYLLAKLIIKLINNIAVVVNRDRRTRDSLQVFFLPDYRVTLAEALIPAADVSEQISLAGCEASGTGNMKFALNGALTVGTLDGANIEIRDAVGAENFFLFGMTVDEVQALQERGYSPGDVVANSPRLARVLDAVRADLFSKREPGVFEPLLRRTLDEGDPFMVLADFEDYCRVQEEVDRVYANPEEWDRRVVCNIANMGRFSSDRSIREYAEKIWGIRPVAVPATPRRD